MPDLDYVACMVSATLTVTDGWRKAAPTTRQVTVTATWAPGGSSSSAPASRTRGRRRGVRRRRVPLPAGRRLRAAEAAQAADRPFGVVLVGHRGAEHGHDAVADELVQGAAQAFDLGPEPGLVGAEQGADVLGVGLVGAGGEADQVAEQHRDDRCAPGGRAAAGGQRRAAGPAELKPPGFSRPQAAQTGMARRGCRDPAGGPRRPPRSWCARPAWPGCWRRGRWPSCG